jgi:hypothetical protein
MTDNDEDVTAATTAGGSTDQYVTGSGEDGAFLTDQPPKLTPANGSSNAGINARHANRAKPGEDPEAMASDAD